MRIHKGFWNWANSTKKKILTSQTCMTSVMWNCSTVVEHSTRIPMIEGSNPATGTIRKNVKIYQFKTQHSKAYKSQAHRQT